MSILQHELWPAIRKYIKLFGYRPDGGRCRIELRGVPREMHAEVTGARMPCVACGSEIQPFRQYRTPGAYYFAGTCPLSVSVGCARTKKASAEYSAIKKELGWDDEPKPTLQASCGVCENDLWYVKWDEGLRMHFLECGSCFHTRQPLGAGRPLKVMSA